MIYPLLSLNFFRYQKTSGKQKGSFTKIFVSVLWDKKFRQNRDALPPRLCMKIFHKRIFLKHQIVLQWNISVQPDKNFSAENRDTPVLSIKFFSVPEFFWNTEWFPGDVFSVPWDNNFFSTKPWIFPLLCFNFFDTRILSNSRRVHLRMLSALWDNNFSKEFSDIPCAKNLPIHEIFWNTEALLNEIFRYCVGHKFLDGETWYPLLSDA